MPQRKGMYGASIGSYIERMIGLICFPRLRASDSNEDAQDQLSFAADVDEARCLA